MSKNFVFALASLVGTIIGAGVFGVPYVMAKSGVLTCLLYFLILGAIVCLLHLFFGEVILRTRGQHRLAGYIERYFGDKAKIFMSTSAIIGLTGSILAYIILGGKFLALVLPFGVSPVVWSIIFWLVLSFFVLLGISSIAPIELAMNIGLFFIIALIFILSIPKIAISNFQLFNSQNLFLPFGIIMFSLIGTSAIPEIVNLLKNKENLKKIIIYASIITVSFSFLFGLVISGLTGPLTGEEPFSGLVSFFGNKMVILGGALGLLAVGSSFLVLTNNLKNLFKLDHDLPYFVSFLLATFPPLILFLIGIRSFITVIGIMGTFIGLVEGVAIILLFKKAKKGGTKKPAYHFKVPNLLLYFIITVLVIGTLTRLFHG